MSFHHISVMTDEVISALEPARGGVFVDGTLGGAGHALALLEASRGAPVRLVGVDRDPEALEAARARLSAYAAQVTLVQGNYRELGSILNTLGVGPVDGVLVDAGVSSHQLDTARRGFSFSQDGPLDMRMGDEGPTALELMGSLSESALADVLFAYGEVRGSRRLAAKIKEALARGSLETTGQLASLCGRPSPRDRIHPATQVFQALRIAVNDEIAGLEALVGGLGGLLRPGGRCALISFHSLEDRVVKHGLRLLEKGPPTDTAAMWAVGPAFVPVMRCLGGLQRPTEAEVERNPRARSARLRAAVRLDGAGREVRV